jgi:hypothetical protein
MVCLTVALAPSLASALTSASAQSLLDLAASSSLLSMAEGVGATSGLPDHALMPRTQPPARPDDQPQIVPTADLEVRVWGS